MYLLKQAQDISIRRTLHVAPTSRQVDLEALSLNIEQQTLIVSNKHLKSNFRSVLSLILCACGGLFAADKYVCDAPQGDPPCQYRNDQLQQAFDEVLPGDTLYLQAGYTYTGAFVFRQAEATADQPIVVTSSRVDWLPGPFTRITPGDIPNIPMLVSNVRNLPALSGQLDSAGRPPSHWHFVGVGFGVATDVQFDNSIIHTAGMGVNGWTIAGEKELPDGLVFDRVYVAGPLDDSLVIQNAVRLNGTNSVFKNSYIHPVYCQGIECHGLTTTTHPGPMEVTNNFLSAASIPIFSGGTTPDYAGAVQKNLVMRFNYLYRPLKWWSNPGNPQRAYFLANGSKIPCTKNLMEFKGLDGGLMEYNVHENVWSDNYCFGQYNAFTASPRQNYWESPAAGGVWGGSLGMGTLTTNGTSFSWTGNPAVMSVGQNVCGISRGVHDCRKIVEVDNAAKKGKVSAAFTNTVTNQSTWLWVTDDTPLMRDITVQHSVFRNVAQGIGVLARDKGTAVPGSDAGRIVRMTVRDNLFENTLAALSNSPAIRIYPQEQSFTVDPTIGARDIVIEHNTFAWPNAAQNVLYFVADTVNPIARIENLSIRSNIFPDATVQGDGNVYALTGSNVGYNDWGVVESFASGKVELSNNYLRYVNSQKCKSAICAQNIGSGNVAVFDPGTYSITSGTALSKAGHDGADVGADFRSLPLIQNLRFTAGGTAGLLEFDLAGPIADALNQQPCTLEISADENLYSMLGPYAVVNDLNPRYFYQATASNRQASQLNKVVATGSHVQWPVGRAAIVTDNMGEARDLSLAPDTQYWGRLMCYGDARWFDFKTTVTTDSVIEISVPISAPHDASTVNVEYGATADLGTTLSANLADVGSSGVPVPAVSGQPLYVRITYLSADGSILVVEDVRILFPLGRSRSPSRSAN